MQAAGLSGQAGAVRHGLSKALTYYEPELRGALKKVGFLTRDSRVVERKKYGTQEGSPELPVLEALIAQADCFESGWRKRRPLLLLPPRALAGERSSNR